MSELQGRFVWCELMTSDADAAIAFYGPVIGWTAKDSGLTDRRYTILSAGETPVCGLMEWPEAAREGGATPRWMGDIGVPDVDAFCARIEKAGGAIHRPPESIPGVGRFSVVSDPQGASFVLFQPADASQAPPPPAGPTPGHVGWHELHATDGPEAFAFYADMFGWTKAEAIDMGPMGLYQLFATGSHAVGGMMTKFAAIPFPTWTFYFNVEAIDAAIARAKDGGGQIINGPHQVPGGSWIAQGIDPQGATFAMVAPGR